jgi:hypothetical protein
VSNTTGNNTPIHFPSAKLSLFLILSSFFPFSHPLAISQPFVSAVRFHQVAARRYISCTGYPSFTPTASRGFS